jgi:hypothetical protein
MKSRSDGRNQRDDCGFSYENPQSSGGRISGKMKDGAIRSIPAGGADAADQS